MAYSVPATNLLNNVVLQALDASSSVQIHDLGYTTKARTGEEFTYCVTAALTAASYAGYPAYWAGNTTAYEVSSDISEVMGVAGADGPIGAAFAGVFTMTVTASQQYYHWVQTQGKVPDASISTNVALSDSLIAKDDTMFDMYSTASESSSHVVARAMEAGTSGFGDIMLLR